jgi:ATP synthase protein I
MAVENQFSTVVKVLYAQALMAVLVTAIFMSIGGWHYAVSPLLGSGVALLPNIFFAYKIYLARALQAQGIVNAFYTGETIKLILTAVLFTLVLQIPGVDFLKLLIGYVAVISVFWFALFYWRN